MTVFACLMFVADCFVALLLYTMTKAAMFNFNQLTNKTHSNVNIKKFGKLV